MKKLILGLLTIASLLMGNTANAQARDKAGVETLVQNYFDALNAGDATKVTSCFTKTGVLLASGAPTATGSEQVNETFKYVFDNFSYSLKVTIGEVIVQGNYAIVSSTSTGSFVIKAKKETVPADYRETFVMLKENGVWKITQYMYNQSK
jgi:uncharacterized protein (TIGR02246 family)